MGWGGGGGGGQRPEALPAILQDREKAGRTGWGAGDGVEVGGGWGRDLKHCLQSLQDREKAGRKGRGGGDGGGGRGAETRCEKDHVEVWKTNGGVAH